MSPVAPVPAYISALIVAIGNAAVAFGAFDNVIAASVESTVVGIVALGFVIANALHHNANAKIEVAKLALLPPSLPPNPSAKR